MFSAFKGRKPDSGGTSSSGNNKSNHNKNPIAYNDSYASLRKIREADPFTKMSIASGDELIDTCVRVTKIETNITDALESPATSPSHDGIGDQSQRSPWSQHSNHNKQSSESASDSLPLESTESNETECQTTEAGLNASQFHSMGSLIGDTVTSLPPAKAPARSAHMDPADADGVHAGRVPVLSGDSNRLLKSGDLNTLRNKNNSNRLGKRLSLTGIGNNLLPTVHGRAKNVAEKTKTRFSHQRNLSLDFRSMGVLLPLVPQASSAHINLTQHHRNRSLDSALQRIPEVSRHS